LNEISHQKLLTVSTGVSASLGGNVPAILRSNSSESYRQRILGIYLANYDLMFEIGLRPTAMIQRQYAKGISNGTG